MGFILYPTLSKDGQSSLRSVIWRLKATKTGPENIELRKVIQEDLYCTYEDIEAETLLSHNIMNKITKKKIVLIVFLKRTPEQKELRVQCIKRIWRSFRAESGVSAILDIL